MDVAGVTFFIVFVAAILGAVAFFSSDDTIKGEAITSPELPSRASLRGNGRWVITVIRASGYTHDVREVVGDAESAIKNVLATLNRANIQTVVLTENNENVLALTRKYGASTGRSIATITVVNAYRASSMNQPSPASSVADEDKFAIGEFSKTFRYGTLDDLENVSFEDFRTEYDRHYAPLKSLVSSDFLSMWRARNFVAYKVTKHEAVLRKKLQKCVDDYGAIDHSKKIKVISEFVKSQCSDHLCINFEQTVDLIATEFISYDQN